MFLNIDQFKDIGFFDDNFFIYFEEIDLCRSKKMKKKIYLDQTIKINHISDSSHNQQLILKWNYQEIGTGCGLLFIIIKSIMVFL